MLKLSLHHVIQSILLWIRELVPQFIQQNYRYKLNSLPSFLNASSMARQSHEWKVVCFLLQTLNHGAFKNPNLSHWLSVTIEISPARVTPLVSEILVFILFYSGPQSESVGLVRGRVYMVAHSPGPQQWFSVFELPSLPSPDESRRYCGSQQ